VIRVFVVEDQALVREGIQSLLGFDRGITVVGSAADGEEAIAAIPASAPDVVLLDMRLPRLSGLDVLRRLAERKELPPTIILTTFDDEEIVLDGLRAGARGYLLKDVSLSELVDAIRAVAVGGRREPELGGWRPRLEPAPQTVLEARSASYFPGGSKLYL